jgi:hypothetical protein
MSPEPNAAHRCNIYEDVSGECDVLTRFLAEGLERGGQCCVVAYREAPDRTVGALAASGTDIAQVLLREALDIVAAAGSPLLAHPFVPAAAVDWVRGMAEKAQARSFTGLWIAIEMRWALASAVGEAGLAAFERGLEAVTRELPVAALCQYDAGAFPKEWLERVTRAHGAARTWARRAE